MPASSSDVHDVTIETAMFPFFFPHGHGHYNGEVGFSEYIKMRIGSLFLIYMLYKLYLLMMYQFKQTIMIANSTNSTMLQRDIDAYRKKNKGASFHDAIRNIVRYKLPSTMPGTPPWHRKNLKDLIAMVDMWGLPYFFLTFTTDEVSKTCWNKIEVIETLAQGFKPNYTWKDCPVECAVLFHTRLHNFLNAHILGGKGILGNVLHYLIRYEIQNRGSLHSHIILWISKDDIENVANEIMAYIPAAQQHGSKCNKLRDLVLQKKIHKCREACRVIGRGSTCKYGFPYDLQPETSPVLDPHTLRWLYYRPGYEHRNIVPYHPTTLLLWKEHMNIQRVTNSSLSRYLLKYAMKVEPITNLNLSPKNAARLGLQGLDKVKLTVISPTVMTKPISATKAALNCLKIPIITKSSAVEYVDSSPHALRQRIISQNQTLIMHPIDLYCARPQELENYIFSNYHKTFKVIKNPPNTSSPQLRDALNNEVLHSPHLMRFTEYHPGHHTEAFFFNVLLQRTTSRTTSELISTSISSSSYYVECQIRKLINSEDDLEMYVTKYTQRNMLLSEDIGHILGLIQQNIILSRDGSPSTSIEDTSEYINKSRLQML
ncbi:hypothetical protein L7F22_058492 [Adiantum nelumboides]|nr:hypothetical protein [Adiantum nelumboides]